MSIEPVSTDINDVGYIQREISAAEQRIQAELQRLTALAEFSELWVDIKVNTSRRLNARETVEGIAVRIRAVL